MNIHTPADLHLAEQRQRHDRYLRCIDREPSLDEHDAVYNPWGSPWLDDVRRVDFPLDIERDVRDLADEVLSDNDGAPRERLDDFVARLGRYDMARALRGGSVGETLHARVNGRVGKRPELRAPESGGWIIDAVGLMRYAAKLQAQQEDSTEA